MQYHLDCKRTAACTLTMENGLLFSLVNSLNRTIGNIKPTVAQLWTYLWLPWRANPPFKK